MWWTWVWHLTHVRLSAYMWKFYRLDFMCWLLCDNRTLVSVHCFSLMFRFILISSSVLTECLDLVGLAWSETIFTVSIPHSFQYYSVEKSCEGRHVDTTPSRQGVDGYFQPLDREMALWISHFWSDPFLNSLNTKIPPIEHHIVRVERVKIFFRLLPCLKAKSLRCIFVVFMICKIYNILFYSVIFSLPCCIYWLFVIGL